MAHEVRAGLAFLLCPWREAEATDWCFRTWRGLETTEQGFQLHLVRAEHVWAMTVALDGVTTDEAELARSGSTRCSF